MHKIKIFKVLRFLWRKLGKKGESLLNLVYLCTEQSEKIELDIIINNVY